MSDIERIVCAVDDSASGVSVVKTARWLADALGGRLIVVHADSDPEAEADPVVAAVHAWLHDAAPEVRVLVGSAAPAILEAADDVAATLLVVGARGRGALRSALLGSVSRDVAARATCPVVVVPAAAMSPDRARGNGTPDDVLVVGVDGSDLSMTAAAFSGRLAQRLGCRPVIVHARQNVRAVLAYPQPSSATPPITGQEDAVSQLAEDIVRRAAQAAGGDPIEIIEPGPPTTVLNAISDRLDARLVVVAARGRRGVSSTLLGSVAAELPAIATRPVVVIPRGAAPRTAD